MLVLFLCNSVRVLLFYLELLAKFANRNIMSIKKPMTILNRLFIILSISLFASNSAFAQEQTSEQTDSVAQPALPTDLHASFLIADPGLDFYSSYGHCVIRLQCPSAGLDFCYTYSLDDNLANEVAMFRGKGKGQYAAIKTPLFIKEYQELKRGVKNYEINLTVEQVRSLWQILDGEISQGAYRQYNYLKTNCSSMSMLALERCLGDEEIKWGELNHGITGTYRNFINVISEHRPWTGFFWTTILGAGGDETGYMGDKMGPTLIVPAMQDAKFVAADGTERPFLKGEPEVVNESGLVYKDWLFTPWSFFAVVLLLAIIVSLLEWKKKAKGVVVGFDIILLALQTIAGIVIFYLSVISDMTGASHNWNLLVLNPLPVILWLAARKRAWYKKVWLVYTVVLIAYIALLPFTPQVDALRVLMISPLLVRCATKAFLNK